MDSPRQTICVLGATGTIGRAVVAELVRRGFDVLCLVRAPVTLAGARVALVDVSDTADLARALTGERVEVVISCMASRTGVPGDAKAVDYQANLNVMRAARGAGVGHFILLSAICVQKPRLAFQHAKLKFEAALEASGMRYSIVRPTAFFKSLSGQVDRVRRGKPYLLFGDGKRTACKPISDGDLAAYIVDCIAEKARWNAVLPIGGPGPAITPLEQGEELFRLLGRKPAIRRVPVAMLDAIIAVLSGLGRMLPKLAGKAELARIGRYYATESMLVLDTASGRYDAEATPSFGSDRLFDHYSRLIAGDEKTELGDHAVFK